jgi:tetratricopeptide (TPR) repeat protein
MFSLFSITPAEKGRKPAGPPCGKEPSRNQTILTWGLIGIWLLLFAFGAISIANPKWLQALSRPGAEMESRNYKDYGDNFLRQNNYRMAISHYKRALEIKPDLVGASVNMAISYSQLGDYARAEKILRDALLIGSAKNGVVYYNLGDLFEKQGKKDQAIRNYRKALDFESQRDLTYRKLGRVYLSGEQYGEAKEAFEMALASELDVTSAYRSVLQSCLDELKDDTINLPIVKEQLASQTRPEDLSAYDLTVIRSMQQKDPEIAKTHNLLGLVYARLGDSTKAIEHFEVSLKIWPGNTDAKKNLQLLRQRQGKG